MRLVNLIEESFTEYKKPHMLIGFPTCTFKCDIEHGSPICQNSALAKSEKVDVPAEDIVARYLSNSITKSIVCAGLEPFDSFSDVVDLLDELRSKNGCMDDFVIYTGYYPYEVQDKLRVLAGYDNVIVKFGRYIPEHWPHFDDVLGIKLASDSQFARWIDRMDNDLGFVLNVQYVHDKLALGEPTDERRD